MIDARNIYRKVTRRIYDFSPEQKQNILAIVWLYRNQTEKYLNLVAGYCSHLINESAGCFTARNDNGDHIQPLPSFIDSLTELRGAMKPFLKTLPNDAAHIEALKELDEAMATFRTDVDKFKRSVTEQQTAWKKQKISNGDLKKAVDRFTPLAESSRNLIKQMDLLYKLAFRLIETCENLCDVRENETWNYRKIARARKASDEARQMAVEQLKRVRYFHRHAHWLTERFPDAKLCDVEGLLKLVDRSEIEAKEWSLSPGRYVGIAPEEEDEDFDFEETLREIHVELEDLNKEATQLAALIKKNFEEMGI